MPGSAAAAPSPSRAGTVAEPGTVAGRGRDGRLQLVLLLGLPISRPQLVLGEPLRWLSRPDGWLSPPDALRPAVTSGSPAAAAVAGREPRCGAAATGGISRCISRGISRGISRCISRCCTSRGGEGGKPACASCTRGAAAAGSAGAGEAPSWKSCLVRVRVRVRARARVRVRVRVRARARVRVRARVRFRFRRRGNRARTCV